MLEEKQAEYANKYQRNQQAIDVILNRIDDLVGQLDITTIQYFIL
jgi:hypothetical protein